MTSEIPLLIAGPIIRRTSPSQLCLWLVTAKPCTPRLEIFLANRDAPTMTLDHQQLPVGEHAYIQLLNYQFDEATPLPEDERIEYDLKLSHDSGSSLISELLKASLYPGELRPNFVIKRHIDSLLHGSCRKPHYPSPDGLLRVDDRIAQSLEQPKQRPALLMMSGDQIYADDVAGPMLVAIHQVIARLKLFAETWQGALLNDSESLYASPLCYYQREELLPHNKANEALRERFFGGVSKPIFTTDSAHNHLISLAEVLAMYFLVWSPSLWDGIDLSAPDSLSTEQLKLYREELTAIEAFIPSLNRIQRCLSHLPVYMIFDDHDITDDWNLTRSWEESAYSHPFSRRIIGNTLIGYYLCQGWGNDPAPFSNTLAPEVARFLQDPDSQRQDKLIDQLLEWSHWHYQLETTPKLLVLDTRTQRWRSESNAAKPSGLMDWESLCALQQQLMNEPSVILVSPAPIFGAKLIEAVQRTLTYCGHALAVDAENWMAHPGAANVLLNIFQHPKTPQRFTILSGDVHYSFAYDVSIRHRKHSPTCGRSPPAVLKMNSRESC
ncbi:metallophosphoesterase family protein [Dongshaea marina]|uniref:alkaline phosphatase family protein n=1 Tax=Dongshaea marina TaxID=2047966 RepID=UPI0018FFFD27|nr:alkaline phosphatase family protein [Dongshaea marina]